MKVIFLDCDGVLNHHKTTDRVGGYTGLCDERIARLNRILEAHPDAKIVVSSTWRKGMQGVYKPMAVDPDGLPNLLKARGVKGEFVGHTKIRFSYVARGDEIRSWIEEWEESNPGQTLTFVILDDDDHNMKGYTDTSYGYVAEDQRDLRPYHVHTDWSWSKDDSEQGGLMDSHVEQAIRILNGEAK